ncbi:50S ribosomal protein L11 methyltransferase [Vagococcus sp. BWB3-3]|uniref:Ribosomal protein L11 methyltransferase n=1 Tax=Vagococcus allomyrinae TaxID=2794353 RepID=A0A940PAQ2_9ENTE|nr:50S ribosomal protein L11 methyltransferase [Vagococcus allomyrinae]MBP1039966.1 50S ribosomal protein L11 methyltransferase [Vagococcus allomyrinae]
MKWTEVKVTTASEAVEAIANIMMEAGASGVAIEDALDVTNFVSDKFGEILDDEDFDHIKEGAIVMAYFPETTFLPEILPTIKQKVNQLPEFGLAIGANLVEIHEVAETDWATAWKKYYHPVSISRYLTIVPNWVDYQAKNEDEKILKLDPGMAFGTGTHPTTMVSLHALEIVLRGGETVLDVGTGSGVLSIASKHLGAKEVYAYDLDDVAVTAAQENVDLNPIAGDVQVSANDLLTGVEIQADVIVANILAEIILRLIPDAWRLVKPGGKLIVSGIIEDKKAEVLEALVAIGFEITEILQQADWFGIILTKPASDQK